VRKPWPWGQRPGRREEAEASEGQDCAGTHEEDPANRHPGRQADRDELIKGLYLPGDDTEDDDGASRREQRLEEYDELPHGRTSDKVSHLRPPFPLVGNAVVT